jgi:hypothetical protein
MSILDSTSMVDRSTVPARLEDFLDSDPSFAVGGSY